MKDRKSIVHEPEIHFKDTNANINWHSYDTNLRTDTSTFKHAQCREADFTATHLDEAVLLLLTMMAARPFNCKNDCSIIPTAADATVNLLSLLSQLSPPGHGWLPRR